MKDVELRRASDSDLIVLRVFYGDDVVCLTLDDTRLEHLRAAIQTFDETGGFG